MVKAFAFGDVIFEICTSRNIPPCRFYRHGLQNRRLWVQVLVPLPKKSNTIWCWTFLIGTGLEPSNATVRGTVARDGLAERNRYFLRSRKCKQVLVPLPEKSDSLCCRTFLFFRLRTFMRFDIIDTYLENRSDFYAVCSISPLQHLQAGEGLSG